MGKTPQPTRAEILDAVMRWETHIRSVGSEWGDDVPPEARRALLRVANSMLRLLMRTGRRK